MKVPYFPVDNMRVIYTKMFSKREKTMVRVMQLKSKKFQNTGLATASHTIPCIFRCAVSIKKVRENGKYWVRVIDGKIR
jgi:hypothetical protein